MEITTIPYGLEENSSGLGEVKFSKLILLMEIGVVLFFTLFPLFFNLPYRINLYLTWEGAYRLYLGQVPFRDFGMPLGYGFFVIPALFFFIFGPATRTLVYAQVFMNLLTYFFFQGTLRKLCVAPSVRFLSVLIFTVSYSFIFFWPWYNHTAFLFQIGGIYFLISAYEKVNFKKYLYIILAAVFTFFSFFTKQDYGGMAFLFTFVLIAYQSYIRKDLKLAAVFMVAAALTAAACIVPLLKHGFLYWFNYGQAPHDSRLSPIDFMNETFGSSAWEKFYLFIILLFAVSFLKDIKAFINNKNQVLLFLLAAGMIVEALIVKVTSRNSLDTTTFYHGFACAFIFTAFNFKEYLKNIYALGLTTVMIILWWSGMYWNYANRIFRFAPAQKEKAMDKPAVVNETWKAAYIPVYEGINLPEGTIQGIARLKKLPLVQQKRGKLKVLNMSELTGLAHELPFTPSTNIPLWYHLNIGMFDKQVKEISMQVQKHEYDMVLFEVIPSLDNFYPEAIRQELKKHYVRIDSFAAPRKEGDSHIEVFTVHK